MSLTRIKFKDKSIEDLFSDYDWHLRELLVRDSVKSHKEKTDIINEVKVRLVERDREIQKLRRELDKNLGRRLGEKW